jgi:hypothetical protein
MFRKTIAVSCSGDSLNLPGHAKVTLNKKDIYRIKQLSEAARDLDVDYIEVYDSTSLRYYENKKRVDDSVEVPYMSVSKVGVHWTGMIKDSNIHWESDSIPLSEIL